MKTKEKKNNTTSINTKTNEHVKIQQPMECLLFSVFTSYISSKTRPVNNISLSTCNHVNQTDSYWILKKNKTKSIINNTHFGTN